MGDQRLFPSNISPRVSENRASHMLVLLLSSVSNSLGIPKAAISLRAINAASDMFLSLLCGRLHIFVPKMAQTSR